MKRLLVGSLCAGGALALARLQLARPASARPAPRGSAFAEIDAYVERQMRRLSIPGVSLAIVEGDQIVHVRGFGRARPGGEAPSRHTPFVLGSTTKSITALAVMQLVEAGEAELDAPVRRYLPWFRVADPGASGQITVRHLLNQTGGLPMIPGMVNLADLDDCPDAGERQARALSPVKLSRPAGAAFEYSNLNYNLLGLIIEAASGETYEEYVRRHIFEPLGMDHSYASQAAARRDGLAAGHRYWFACPVAIPDLPVARGSLPSGQLISCAEDMARYLIAHLNRGCFDRAQLLSSAGMDELHRGVGEQRVFGTLVGAYGMGWFVSEIGGVKLLSHSGNVPDFASYMALLPEQQKGIVLLANSDPWGLPMVADELGHGAAALLAGEPEPPVRFCHIPWVMRAQPLIPLLQLVAVLATLRLLRRWRQDPGGRPGPASWWGRHVALPLIPNLALVAALVYVRASGLLRYMHLYMPDFSWIVRISGGFAGIWSVVRTGLLVRAWRKRRPRQIGMEDTDL